MPLKHQAHAWIENLRIIAKTAIKENSSEQAKDKILHFLFSSEQYFQFKI